MLDLVVVGGGILGAATAYRYGLRHPEHAVLLLEKEAVAAPHQSGHNSGVLHSGLIYAPGSAKARHCHRGKQWMEQFCQAFGIPFETCGKLILATRETELPRLVALRQRAIANGIEVHSLQGKDIQGIEPAAAGIAGLHVPSTGIVDYARVTRGLLEQLQANGGQVQFGREVFKIEEAAGSSWVHFNGGDSSVQARRVIVCAGLQADRLAERSGVTSGVRVVPFLGEYYSLKTEYQGHVRGLIYPVADPRFPFLGVHLTRRMDGGVDCGPNAIPTFHREGYSKSSFRAADAANMLSWPGTWRLGARYFRIAAAELHRSLSQRAFARDLARLCPALEAHWLELGPRGVRAQIVDRKGLLVDDFHLQRQGSNSYLLNAPSPAATSSLSLAEELLGPCSPALD
jgi:L-2-hydroxyglutarate oxidase